MCCARRCAIIAGCAFSFSFSFSSSRWRALPLRLRLRLRLRLPLCPGAAAPAYPAPEAGPHVEVWTTAEVLKTWAPPACARWIAPRYRTLIQVTGSIPTAAAADLLQRFGAVSNLRGTLYWSVSDHRLETLILDAHAVNESRTPRRDFTFEEMRPGPPLLFAERDNRASGDTLYKMSVATAADDRIVIEQENASTVRLAILPLFRPGDIRSVYFLNRRSDGTWGYLSLTGVSEGLVTRGNKSEKSSVNRSLALYGVFSGSGRSPDLMARLPWAR